MKRIIFAILSAVVWQLSVAQPGTWHAFMAYHEIQDVKEGSNMLFVLASNDLFTYNENDQSIRTYDKVNGLSDCSISKIEWNNTVRRLLILYDNYNIDLLDAAGNITNISDYYTKSLTSDKTVNSICMSDRFAYLCTGFGIVKVDMRDAEISDTYNLRLGVNYCYISGDSIFAASQANGLYGASRNSNLLDPANWSRVGNYTARTYTVDSNLLAMAQTLNPGGPDFNKFYDMKFHNGKLYTVGGGYTDLAQDNNPGRIQIWNGTSWLMPDRDVDSLSDHNYQDLASIDIDPFDDNHYFASGRTGLYEFRDNRFYKEYTPANSPLRGAASVSADSKDYNIVMGVKFDGQGNLWVLNSKSATTSLLEYTRGGEWVDDDKQILHGENGRSLELMMRPFFDTNNLLWFVNNHWRIPSIGCYQPSTDGANLYTNFVNEDGSNVSLTRMRCCTQDLEGNIWMGSDVGPLYIPASDIGTSSSDMVFQQYKVPRNDGTDLADYLLTGLDITGIAVDGANRKWFATSGNGVYLISADNNTQLQHFLASNSPLLSDNVEAIAINPRTGEVFFGTDQGLCSYMSDASATVDEMNKDVTYAYPNPVRPGYTGPITITGLTFNADVKIVTTNGVLVAQGRSNGGMFVWDGRDLDGKRVASGVYMVETATQEGDKGTVCKIAIVN